MADPASIPLNLADQTLINLAGVLCCRIFSDEDTRARDAMWMACADEVLPHINRSNPLMTRLSGAMAQCMATAANRGLPGGAGAWSAAVMDLQTAALAIYEWRAAGALDKWRSQVTQ